MQVNLSVNPQWLSLRVTHISVWIKFIIYGSMDKPSCISS